MRVKYFLIVTVLLISGMSAFAQKESSSSAILRGGVNLANISISDDGEVDENKMLASFQVGAVVNFRLTNFLALQPGLVLTGKGSKTQSGEPSDDTYYRATSNPLYIEVPVNLVFKTPTGNSNFFVGAGPYIAIGIAGKNKVDGKLLGTTFTSNENIKWSNDDPTTSSEEGGGYGIMRRFDYGLNGTIGIEAGKTVISANYGLGLAKLQSNTSSSSDNNNKHRVISLTIGFKL